jgi:hypothetical protein
MKRDKERKWKRFYSREKGLLESERDEGKFYSYFFSPLYNIFLTMQSCR